MSVIAIINQKGGCGKTTTAINLAATLAFREKNVLLIDFDPQGHSSLGLGVDEAKLNYSLYHVLVEKVSLETACVPLKENLSLLPSNISLASLEQVFSGTEGREYILRKVLESGRKEFDYIIIDCPPHLGILSVNVLLASDKIIVPIEPNRFGLDGLKKLNQTIEVLCKKANHSLQKRYLLSLFDIDSDFSQTFARKLQRDYGNDLFQSRIHRTSVIREAIQAGKPVVDFDQNSISFMDFMSLAHEVMVWENEAVLKQVLSDRSLQPRQTQLGVCFLHKAPEANSVQISGSFNNWDPERTPLIKLSREGIWYTFLPLQQGKHTYQYVIDGKFSADPHNPEAETSLFGVSQSVLVI